MTRYPPYQIAAMMPTAPMISMSGSVISSARTFFNERCSRRWLSPSKRSCSCASRPKALTIFVPVNDSWSSTTSCAPRSWARLLIL